MSANSPTVTSPAPTFKEATRVLTSVLAPVEKRTLLWLAARMPRAINSDHLTVLALLAMVAAWAAREYAIPALRRIPLLWPVVETAGWALTIALVFVFLRPISQFIYFQF